MNRSNELSVTPVKRYRVPRYPSHADPDPTRVPYPVPYPWNSQAVVALASLGIAASCSREPSVAAFPPPIVPERAAAVEPADPSGQPTAGSPFLLANTGLPHVSSMFGTGAPNYLDDDLAREAIERVFRESGYHLHRRCQYDRDRITFLADGYDPEHRVGYIYADNVNLDHDATEWRAEPGNTEMVDRCLEDLADVAEYNGEKEAVNEINSIRQLTDPARREAAYRAYLAKDRRNKLSLAEAESLLSRAGKDGEFVAVISHFDDRFAVSYYSDEFQAKQSEVALIADPVKRAAISKVIRQEAVQEVVDRLERTVREYIAWARSQGLQ
ncbi:MAG TPA: hypothetical protein VG826_23640 [Pirellulales bacterium]|nr:hypothetical protein [Pirellulales bacterium]